ncbi:hypothetical protein ABK040_002003 [Willaertia magna]
MAEVEVKCEENSFSTPNKQHNESVEITMTSMSEEEASTPQRSKSPVLPKSTGTRSPEKHSTTTKSLEVPRLKAWSKQSPWSLSKTDRFKGSQVVSPNSTHYSPNLSSLEIKDGTLGAFKSTSPRFKDPKIQSPPPTQYFAENVDIENMKKGSLVNCSFTSTTKRSYEVEEKPRSPSPVAYSPNVSSIDKNKAVVSSFKSKFDRFKDPKVESPPSTKYSPRGSAFSVKKEPSSAFNSHSPRLTIHKTKVDSPPPTKYDVDSVTTDFKKVTPSPVPFASNTDRWTALRFEEKERQLFRPDPGKYYQYHIPEIYDIGIVARNKNK